MTEERTVETRDAEGNMHTHTTIVRDTDGAPRSGGGGAAKWIMLFVAIVAAVAIIYIVSQGSAAEAAKDNAVADAAGQVGNAAEQIGDTVDQVGDEVTGGGE